MPRTRIGFYCWAGPGTIRMTNLKYFFPKIDHYSFLTCYDYSYLKSAQRQLGITDVWVTYSWGFAPQTEAEDYEFIVSRLPYFHKLHLKTHAYIQGPNLVYQDFKKHNWWARDERGNLIPYHRGRKVVCVNNPEFRTFLKQKISQASQHTFSGIFIDNIQMGKLGLPHGKNRSSAFVGCACDICQSLFKAQTGHAIPRRLPPNNPLTHQYLQFRTRSTTSFLTEMAEVAHAHGKLFGSNSFDPQFDTEYTYGTNLAELHDIQDYLLFENHALRKTQQNNYVAQLMTEKNITKPVFTVSYHQGIGYDSQYTHHDMTAIMNEAVNAPFFPCVKGSEFITNKTWHNFDLRAYHQSKSHSRFTSPRKRSSHNSHVKIVLKLLYSIKPVDDLLNHTSVKGYELFMESSWVRHYFGWLYKKIIA